jgi:hypothetical protein
VKLKEEWPLGSRVKRNPDCHIGAGRLPDRVGTVIGYSRIAKHCVRILWDGNRGIDSFSISYLLKIPLARTEEQSAKPAAPEERQPKENPKP